MPQPSASRLPAANVPLVVLVAALAVLCVTVAAVVPAARNSQRDAQMAAAAAEVLWHTLSTADTFGCDRQVSRPVLTTCRAAFGRPGLVLGSETSTQRRGRITITTRLEVSISGSCTGPAQVRRVEAATLTRSAAVTVSAPGARRRDVSARQELALPAGEALLVPARAGASVLITTADGVPVRRTASPDGCAVFLGVPHGDTRVPGDTVVAAAPGGPR